MLKGFYERETTGIQENCLSIVWESPKMCNGSENMRSYRFIIVYRHVRCFNGSWVVYPHVQTHPEGPTGWISAESVRHPLLVFVPVSKLAGGSIEGIVLRGWDSRPPK